LSNHWDITGITQAQKLINNGILQVLNGTGTVNGDVTNNYLFNVIRAPPPSMAV